MYIKYKEITKKQSVRALHIAFQADGHILQSIASLVLEGGQLVLYFLLDPLKLSPSDRSFKCKGFPFHKCIRRERHDRRGKETRREELDMEILSCFDLHGRVVVRLVTLEFGDYALVWWIQMLEGMSGDLKRMMRKRFVLSSYTRDLHNKLQRLYQGSRSVEEYHKKMEMDLMRAQIRESEKATMARILYGLNREIQVVVELQYYDALGELVHQVIKVDMQIRRRIVSRKAYVGTSSWNGKEGEKENSRREKSSKKGSDSSLG
ncbi:hypothetical protein CR513_11216, partial [Mucuna pruriens]